MPVSASQLAKAIRAYRKEIKGTAWDIFWDYKRGVEKAGASILDDARRDQTALQLYGYLCAFQMGRGSTRLTNTDLAKFADVLAEVQSEEFRALLACRFERLGDDYHHALTAVRKQLVAGLKRAGVSQTDTMVTKILMALWGEIPAFDTYFKKTYRVGIGPWPYWSMETTVALDRLRGEYRDRWKLALDILEPQFTHTQRGHNNPIPVARLIDMGFWYLAWK